MNKKIISFFIIFSLIFTFVGCKKDADDVVLRYSIVDSVQSFDPSLASTQTDLLVVENLFEGLLRFDENNSLYSEICDDYYVSDDELTYTFILKENLVWNNGTPLKSDDFRFAVERALTKETETIDVSRLFSIKNAKNFYNKKVSADKLGIETKNDYTISFILEEKDPSFLSLIASPIFMPGNREFFENTKGKYGLDEENIITNGAFAIKQINDEFITLTKNIRYVSAKNTCVDKLYIYQNTDNETAKQKFEDGDLDIISFDAVDFNNYNKSYNVYSYSNITYSIVFNPKDDISNNKYFRKMIFSCADLDVLSASFPPQFTKAEGIIPPSCYCNEINYRQSVNPITFDYDKKIAKKSFDKFMSSLKDPLPKLTIIYPDTEDFKEIVTEFVYVYQKNFSIFINPQPVAIEDFDDVIQSGEYQLAFVDFTSNEVSPTEILSIFKKDSGTPFSLKKDKEYDALFKSIPVFSDDFADSVRLCENYLIKDKMSVLPLAFGCTYFASNKNISNIKIKASGSKLDFRVIKKG
jgi:oligopeptide transport system substrate-binding protein